VYAFSQVLSYHKSNHFLGGFFKVHYGMYPGFVSRQHHPDTKKSPCDYRMTIVGKGRVNALPDRASVVLGVVTEGAQLKTKKQACPTGLQVSLLTF